MIPNAHLKQANEALPINIFDNPKMIQAKLITKLSDLMEERHKKFLLYGALEGKELVFYFSHNAITYEFINSLENFRAKIIPLYKELKMRENLYFTNIKAKTKHKAIEKKPEKEFYRDRAKGDFVIEVGDDAIRASFEKIRKTIQNSHEEQA